MSNGIRVMVVDDSAVVREALRAVLERDPGIAAVETASDGRVALRKLQRFCPDVITLDVEMPGLDGLGALKEIMRTTPTPVIMLSAFTFQGARKTIRALELGAVDFIQKPSGEGSTGVAGITQELLAKVLAIGATSGRARSTTTAPPPPEEGTPGLQWKFGRRPSPTAAAAATTLVAIGASTGGTEAIRHVVSGLPKDFDAALVVTQHMPEGFTLAFANRLNELAAIEVKEAAQHDLIRPGRALIAPGNSHLTIRREDGVAFVELTRQPQVNGHRPSVDVMFHSAAQTFGSQTIGVLLTGMGRDGAQGLLEIRNAGGITVAESQESCVVFGMPKAAMDVGAAAHVSHLDEMPGFIMRFSRMRQTMGQ